MDSLEEIIDDTWKSILSLRQFHLSLYQMSNLKILNRQELSQNPYIADQLRLYQAELIPKKEEIEAICEKIKEAIEVLAVGKESQQNQREENLLMRVVTRGIEVVNSASIEQDNAYYQFYNQKFRNKCARVIKDIKGWEIFEVIKILYKYFRHVVLIQLERYEEILDCLTKTDFQSLHKFKDFFYSVLQKKESSKKQNRLKDLLLPRDTATSPASEQLIFQKVSLPTKPTYIEQNREQANLKPVSLLCIPQEQTVPSEVVNVEFIHSQTSPIIDNVPGDLPSKRKQQNKSTKKLFFLLGPVMGIKKQHFISQHANKSEENSMLAELVSRNKTNHKQINDYFSYAQQMEKHLSLNHSADFYYYREDQPFNPIVSIEKSATQKKRIRFNIPKSQRQSIFASQQSKKSEPLLTVNLEKPRYHHTIHKSVYCRGKAQPNAEAKEIIEQKPLKIDSDFLEINLRKVLPTRRQPQFDQMIAKASSLGTIKHEIHTRRVQVASENVDKVSSDVFRTVKILHQGQFNAEKEAKIYRERQKHHQHAHDNKIQSRIKEELKGEHLEDRPEDLKKIWRDQITFKKFELG